MSPRARAVLSGLAVAVLFALPLLPEILGTKRLVFRDAQVTHWPWRRVAMESLRAGEVPFVNAAASGGQPLLANPNAVLLYPTLLLEKVLPETAAFNLHYLLHVIWAFCGARLLARRLGLADGSAFLAGVAFAFSGVMLSYGAAFMNSVAAASWLPWCAAAALGLERSRGTRATSRAAAAAGLALGLQLLAGEPAISLLTGFFLLFLTLAEALASPDRWRRLKTLALGGAGAMVIALLFAAPLLLPLQEVFPLTYRGLHLYSERAFGAAPFEAWRLVEWLFPRAAGDPGSLGGGASWLQAIGDRQLVYLWSVTLGVVPLLLILVAAVGRGFWESRTATLTAGAVLTLLFSFGLALPLYRLLFQIEFLRRLRYPIKFYLLTTLFAALLSGFAAEHLRRQRVGRPGKALLLAVLMIYGAGFLLAGKGGLLDRVTGPLVREIAPEPALFLSAFRRAIRGDALLGAGAVGIVVLLLLPRRRIPGRGYTLGFATLVSAFFFGLPLFVAARERELCRAPALLAAVQGPGRLYVSPKLPRFDAATIERDGKEALPSVSKVARVLVEQLVPATAVPFGVRYLFDHDPDGSYGYYNRIAGEAFSAARPPERDRLLRLYGASFSLVEEGEEHPLQRPVTGFAVAGVRLVLHAVEGPVPELRWAGRAHRRASLSEAIELVRSDAFDPATDVVLPAPASQSARGFPTRARVSIESLSPGRAAAGIEADGAGHLLFSRTYFPAWKATLDRKPAPVLVANARELAVAVPAGRHRVEFEYDRAPFRLGVLLQAAVLLAAVAATLGRRGRRAIGG
jgi:hypothetical protein